MYTFMVITVLTFQSVYLNTIEYRSIFLFVSNGPIYVKTLNIICYRRTVPSSVTALSAERLDNTLEDARAADTSVSHLSAYMHRLTAIL